MKGKVKWFNRIRNYGFIETDEGDVFVHGSEVKGVLREGDEVEFDLVEGEKGKKAINVRKVKS